MVGSPPVRTTEKVLKGSVDGGADVGSVQGLKAGLVSAGLASEGLVSAFSVSGVPDAGVTEVRGFQGSVMGFQGAAGGDFQGSDPAEGVASESSVGLELRAVVAGVQSSVGLDVQSSVVAEEVVPVIAVSEGPESASVAGFQESGAGVFQDSVVAELHESFASVNSASGVSEFCAQAAEFQRSVGGDFQGPVGLASDQAPGLADLEVAPTLGVQHGSADSLVHDSGLDSGRSQFRVSEHPQRQASDAATVAAAKSGLSSSVAVGEVELTQPVINKSYLIAAQARPTLERHDLTLDEGDQCFVVPEEILSNSSPLWEDLIVGNFPETAPHIAKIHVIVNKIWTFGNKLVKIDAFVVNSTTIKFRIRDKSDPGEGPPSGYVEHSK